MNTASNLDFVSCVKEFIERQRRNDKAILSEDDITELLRTDDNSAGWAIIDDIPRSSIIGYPTRPLYREIGTRLDEWYNSKSLRCPMLDLPTFDLLDEKEYQQNRLQMIEEINPILKKIKSLHTLWTNDEIYSHIRDIIYRLGRRGLLDLLGMRKTVGSFDSWPPPRKTLENSFCQNNSPESGSILSVGARALAKHSHRDRSSSWWGDCTGSESAKNAHAVEKMRQILDNAVWINIHHLPHDVRIIEARQENGYGVRWTSDGTQFRGFLEPQMIDGHEVGWRH